MWQGHLFLIHVVSQARHSIVRRGFHPLTSDVPVIQSNYTERNRYCYTQGIDSRQNRKVKCRLHSHLQPCTTWLESHTHSSSHTQIQNHMDEQLQYLSDNKSLQGSTASVGPAVESVWQVCYSNLKWCRSSSAPLPQPHCRGDRPSFYGDNCRLMEQLSNTGLNDNFNLLSRVAQTHSSISRHRQHEQSHLSSFCIFLSTPTLIPKPVRVSRTTTYL